MDARSMGWGALVLLLFVSCQTFTFRTEPLNARPLPTDGLEVVDQGTLTVFDRTIPNQEVRWPWQPWPKVAEAEPGIAVEYRQSQGFDSHDCRFSWYSWTGKAYLGSEVRPFLWRLDWQWVGRPASPADPGPAVDQVFRPIRLPWAGSWDPVHPQDLDGPRDLPFPEALPRPRDLPFPVARGTWSGGDFEVLATREIPRPSPVADFLGSLFSKTYGRTPPSGQIRYGAEQVRQGQVYQIVDHHRRVLAELASTRLALTSGRHDVVQVGTYRIFGPLESAQVTDLKALISSLPLLQEGMGGVGVVEAKTVPYEGLKR